MSVFFSAGQVAEACRDADQAAGLQQRFSRWAQRLQQRARHSLGQVACGAECFARREPYKALVAAVAVGSAAGLLVRRAANGR